MAPVMVPEMAPVMVLETLMGYLMVPVMDFDLG